VLVCFRNGGANDLVVDAGPISTLTGAAPNQRIPINQYSPAQLNAAFGGPDAVNWSAFTWLSDNTLFVTQARSSLDTQTAPFAANSSAFQNNTVKRMATIPTGAAVNIAFNGLNNSTAVIEPDSISTYHTGSSYANALLGSAGGQFNNTFVGNPENTTLGDFSTSGTVARSDFYQMTPTASLGQVGTFLGYFEFAPDGTMTYVAYPSAVPIINSISRSGNTSTINYTTGLYGTYTLRGTNTLSSGVSATNWPPITTLTSGDTSVHNYMDTDSSDIKFYIITAQ
jgi:hypothetical protein